jgi:acetate kinase
MNAHEENLLMILNAGSSSLKFAVFNSWPALTRTFTGAIDRVGSSNALFTLSNIESKQTERTEISATDHVAGLEHLLECLSKTSGAKFSAVGHRVVHGGPRHHKPERVDNTMLSDLQSISAFDPEHLPAQIALMESLATKFPNTPQIACFDTAFHNGMPRVAKLLPIPRRYESKGVRRYGFHGLSYEYLMTQPHMQGRVILAHLGNGASLAAVRNGQPVDTSMAFTPAAGLPMSTRSGDLDPGLVGFLARTENMTAEQFHSMINRQSGLLGVSETSSDMRDLLASEPSDQRAADAVALFCYQTKKWIGSFAAALGGLDTLVFTGGIGQNDPVIRARICEGLGFLGIELDQQQNAQNAEVISTSASRAAVRVIRTDEELMIANHVWRFLKGEHDE